MPKELTLKDRDVLTALVDTRDWRKAIMQVYGYTKETTNLRQRVYNKKAKLMKKTRLSHYLEAHDLGHSRLAGKLDELLEASKTVGAGRDEDGELLFAEKPEYTIQMRALDLLAEISGAKQKQKSSTIGTQVNQLIVETESVEAAKVTAKAIEEKWGIELINPDYEVEELRDGESVD